MGALSALAREFGPITFATSADLGAVSLLVFYFVFQPASERGTLLPHFFASLFYAHGLVYGSWSEINAVTWSLEIEVQFYILAPLLCRVFSIRPTWPRATLPPFPSPSAPRTAGAGTDGSASMPG